jgi:hypothetical protein
MHLRSKRPTRQGQRACGERDAPGGLVSRGGDSRSVPDSWAGRPTETPRKLRVIGVSAVILSGGSCGRHAPIGCLRLESAGFTMAGPLGGTPGDHDRTTLSVPGPLQVSTGFSRSRTKGGDPSRAALQVPKGATTKREASTRLRAPLEDLAGVAGHPGASGAMSSVATRAATMVPTSSASR